MRKQLSVVLVLILALGCAAGWTLEAKAEEGMTTLRIHYHRPDEDYDIWNLWIWPQGSEGKVYAFDEEDDFGKIATVDIPGVHNRVGFIVRTNDWLKDVEADRFVEEFQDGTAEIWLVSGDPTIYTAPPSGFEVIPFAHEKVNVTVHYYRYDGEYDGWNLWMWAGNQGGRSVSFIKEDETGLTANTTFDDLTNVTSLGIIVRKSVPGNDWAAKDVEQDRFIPLFRSDRDGNIEVWLMQNDPVVYYREEDLDRSPRIVTALLDEPNVISVEVNLPFTVSGKELEGFYLSADGQELEIQSVDPVGRLTNGRTRKVTITTKENLDLNRTYTLKKTHYEPAIVGLGNVFSSKAFEEQFHYAGDDLGAVYTKEETKFRVWAPTASRVEIVTYEAGEGGVGTSYPMTSDVKGTWTAVLPGDHHGLYYTYRVTVGGQTNEAVDPYAWAVGVNGDRGMVIDLRRTNPPGFGELKKPEFVNFVDAVIYELHVRDLSSHPNAGIANKGKFLGIIEEGTRGPEGVKTGLGHLKELGITHLHLLPSFDYATVDETRLDEDQFNWGYDPKNYNVPEGSYSTDPYNGEVRIREFKEMVKGLNENGIRVVLDVVYNHTSKSSDSHLNLIVPGYYYRMNPDGSFCNGSGWGMS